MKYLLIYLLIVNACAFILMLVDKQRARKKQRRIPEAVLISTAALGGSVGMLLGMYLIRHKTRHLKFTLGVPAILTVQLAAAYLILRYI